LRTISIELLENLNKLSLTKIGILNSGNVSNVAGLMRRFIFIVMSAGISNLGRIRMNKNWLILLLVTILILEYKTGYRKVMSVPDNYKITYPTTVIRLRGKARGHKKYIDMRMIKRIYKYKLEEK